MGIVWGINLHSCRAWQWGNEQENSTELWDLWRQLWFWNMPWIFCSVLFSNGFLSHEFLLYLETSPCASRPYLCGTLSMWRLPDLPQWVSCHSMYPHCCHTVFINTSCVMIGKVSTSTISHNSMRKEFLIHVSVLRVQQRALHIVNAEYILVFEVQLTLEQCGVWGTDWLRNQKSACNFWLPQNLAINT